jgi:hypothetical protein
MPDMQEEEPHIKKTMKNKKEKVEYILRVNTVSFKVKKKKQRYERNL